MNEVGNCDAFQYVQAFEIEPDGTMWFADMGHVLPLDDDVVACPPKIVWIDYYSGEVTKVYEFPEEVAPLRENHLNDMVLDISDPEDKFAYFTDSHESTIIVYSLKQDRSWKVYHPTMEAVDDVSDLEFV